MKIIDQATPFSQDYSDEDVLIKVTAVEPMLRTSQEFVQNRHELKSLKFEITENLPASELLFSYLNSEGVDTDIVAEKIQVVPDISHADETLNGHPQQHAGVLISKQQNTEPYVGVVTRTKRWFKKVFS